MAPATPAIQDLARRLIALELLRDSVPLADGNAAVRVCEKLRTSIAKFAGVAGYRSLVSRALAMAKTDTPRLESVQVRLDGSLDGFGGTGENQNVEAAGVILVHLLGLLVTFIGEPLTLSLVRSAWPDHLLDNTHRKSEEPS